MQVFTVSEINGYVKSIFDEDAVLSEVVVTGEISNLKNHSSGHMYFTLKDESAAISAAMFKWNRKWMRFVPENGMKVIAHGKITLYEPSGQFQLVVTSLQPDGAGELFLAYEQLRRKLEGEGLFDQSRKKPIPEYPERVGVVTSKTGAAVQDIINVISRRYPPADIVLCPVQVQGIGSSQQIAAAIACLNETNACDVMIVGRGGGSIEDLWSFNTEIVVRAVAASDIPVISAVGHETDFTLCDFAADLRAPTPSAAAELAVPDGNALLDYIRSLSYTCRESVKMRIKHLEMRTDKASHICEANSPQKQLQSKKSSLDNALLRINASVFSKYESAAYRLSSVCAKLAALNPLSVLSRGYCIASDGDRTLYSAQEAKECDRIELTFADGSINCTPIE